MPTASLKKKIDSFVIYFANDVLKGEEFTREFCFDFFNMHGFLDSNQEWSTGNICNLDRREWVYQSITRLCKKSHLVYCKTCSYGPHKATARTYKINGVFEQKTAHQFLIAKNESKSN